MNNSKTYYGGISLEKEDLEETNINHRIELEYYGSKMTDIIKENEELYEIEIIKREYKEQNINTESQIVKYVSDSVQKVIDIIETLKKNKVTPIGLQDVVEDLLQNKAT